MAAPVFTTCCEECFHCGSNRIYCPAVTLWQEQLEHHILLMLRLCAQQSFEKHLLIKTAASWQRADLSGVVEQKFSANNQNLITFYICLGSVRTAANGGGIHDCWIAVTYHSRAWIGNFSLERDPLVIGPLFVSKGPQEGPPDVIHGVETHS